MPRKSVYGVDGATGELSPCRAKPENRGRGKCHHAEHMSLTKEEVLAHEEERIAKANQIRNKESETLKANLSETEDVMNVSGTGELVASEKSNPALAERRIKESVASKLDRGNIIIAREEAKAIEYPKTYVVDDDGVKLSNKELLIDSYAIQSFAKREKLIKESAIAALKGLDKLDGSKGSFEVNGVKVSASVSRKANPDKLTEDERKVFYSFKEDLSEDLVKEKFPEIYAQCQKETPYETFHFTFNQERGDRSNYEVSDEERSRIENAYSGLSQGSLLEVSCRDLASETSKFVAENHKLPSIMKNEVDTRKKVFAAAARKSLEQETQEEHSGSRILFKTSSSTKEQFAVLPRVRKGFDREKAFSVLNEAQIKEATVSKPKGMTYTAAVKAFGAERASEIFDSGSITYRVSLSK